MKAYQNLNITGSINLSGSFYAPNVTASYVNPLGQDFVQINNKIKQGTAQTPAGNFSVAMGNNTLVSGAYSMVIGSNNFISASSNASFVAGQYNTASEFFQAVVGQFNALNNNSAAFIVGGGTSTSNRKNTAVFTTSSIILSGSVEISGSLLINGAKPSGGGASVTISGSAPSGSFDSGSLWWNENDGNLYIQVTTPTGSTYVPATNTVAGGNYGATLTTARTGSIWSINHNLNTSTPIVTVYSGSSVMIPASITSTDANNTVIVFSGSVQGTAVLSTGVGNQTLALATSASFATTSISSSFASTASAFIGSQPTYIQALNGGGQTIPTGASLTVINNWVNTFALNTSEWNITTGVFTATKAGWYSAAAALTYASVIDNINAEYAAGIAKNGAIIANNRFFVPLTQTTASFKQIATPPVIVQLAVGDTMTVVAQQFTGANRTLHTNGNYVSIQELPTRIQR